MMRGSASNRHDQPTATVYCMAKLFGAALLDRPFVNRAAFYIGKGRQSERSRPSISFSERLRFSQTIIIMTGDGPPAGHRQTLGYLPYGP